MYPLGGAKKDPGTDSEGKEEWSRREPSEIPTMTMIDTYVETEVGGTLTTVEVRCLLFVSLRPSVP